MKIGNIELGERPVFFAPMEDISDPSFRRLCKEYGADMMYTEFISSEGLIRDAEKSLRKLDVADYERPVGIQIYGKEIDSMVEAAKRCEEAKPDLIDLNFGCPVKKVAGKGAGAGLLQNIPLMLEITAAVVKAVKVPVTVKTRLGWDEESKVIVELSEQLQDCGIAALTVHGRTRKQMYKGEADWTLIGEIKNNQRMIIPIIGNGDVTTPEIAKEKFDNYGVDAIMIGRGAIGKPWLFRDVKYFLETGKEHAPITIPEKVELAKRHLNYSLEWKGDVTGVFEMRQHFSNYFKGLYDFKSTRIKLVTETNPDELVKILDEIAIKWGEF
ncbi:MAG: tRNA dihydrouridine synthase DusB [Salinivirgaceae bacterium]|nr:tRNA dihydrouridine synthase DusB [Salinivirgaceae bacterium]